MGDDACGSGQPEEVRGEAPQAGGGRGAHPTITADPHRSTRMVLLLALLVITLWTWWEYRQRIPPIPPPPPVVMLQTRQQFADHAGKSIRVIHDLPYSYQPGIPPEQLAMDLFIPESARAGAGAGAGACPVLVYLHGGGWWAGNKNGVGPKAFYFASRGILVASVNYRLSDVRPKRHGAFDVADAIRFLRREIGGFGGDPNRIFIMGHSAGAHLGALAICNPALLADKDPAAAKAIRGAILLDGSAYDVPKLMETEKAEDFHAFFGDNPADWLPVSPYHYAIHRTGLPPMLLVHAGGDPTRQLSAERLASALRAGGSSAWLVDMPMRDHYGVDSSIGEEGDPLTPLVERFIRDNGKLD